jgi:hypothetical protein
MASKVRVLWKVQTYGCDCNGHISGYRVYRYVENMFHVAITYPGDVYERGSFEAAEIMAKSACNALNRVKEEDGPKIIETLKQMFSELCAKKREDNRRKCA